MSQVNPRGLRPNKIPTRPCFACAHPLPLTLSRCPACLIWQELPTALGAPASGKSDQTVLLSDVEETEVARYSCPLINYCFGGGIARTGVHLIGGAPGAGKSTLSLQVADAFCSAQEGEILYVGSEETVKEIKARGSRLKLSHMNRTRMLPIGALDEFQYVITKYRPIAAFFDSLVGFTGADLEAAVSFCQSLKLYAIDLNAPMIVIDHVNKDEEFAGLIKKQFFVDATFSFFPIERGSPIRILETIKNRYGAAGDVSSLYAMTETGLKHLVDSSDRDKYAATMLGGDSSE